MAAQTRGFCKYCGKEYTKAGMLRHISSCKKRMIALEKENLKRNPQGYYEGTPFWCEECLNEEYGDEEGEYCEPEFLLPICNSPRMGVCGYEGSNTYPDQFEPDKE